MTVHNIPKTVEEEIIHLYKTGMSENSIAKKFGYSRSVIRLRLHRAGESIRGQVEANRLMISMRTPQQRRAWAAAANEAARVRKHTEEEKIKRAITREAKQLHISALERYLQLLLEKRGFKASLQKAIGPYNCDIAIGHVAVEIYGGGWHSSGRHAARSDERFEYLLSNGWNVVVIWVDNRIYPLKESVIDAILDHFNPQVKPSERGSFLVLRGNGTVFATNSDDLSILRVKPNKCK